MRQDGESWTEDVGLQVGIFYGHGSHGRLVIREELPQEEFGPSQCVSVVEH